MSEHPPGFSVGGDMLDITLPIDLTNGNDGRSKSWYKPAIERKFFEALLIAKYRRQTPLDYPVRLVVTRILGPKQRLWDYSSILRGSWKELEDAMVACGFFHDDGPKWITSVVGDQDDSQRENGPSVRVEAFRSQE